MYQVKCLNKISPLGTSRLGENYHVGEDVENPDAILVRSAAMHDMEFNKNLLAIARAGAGTNNIPVERCVQEGIVVFNTPMHLQQIKMGHIPLLSYPKLLLRLQQEYQ